ncbi:MAG: hypothetical protein FJZ00_10995, partial [Candidatus Sericytochromatia bacterium]|nr:hypothetical protein [Candidatus Tanganyikabacteria bacterium]
MIESVDEAVTLADSRAPLVPSTCTVGAADQEGRKLRPESVMVEPTAESNLSPAWQATSGR